jgi:hypothetical protein
MANIDLNKQTGDLLSATEINNLATSINSKIDYYSLSSFKTSTNTPNIVYIQNGNNEGFFEYDVTDITSVGDDIDIIIRNDGKRFKRKTIPISTYNASKIKTLLSLNNVDNTSDINKPISTATQNALNDKVSYSEYTNGAISLGDYNATTNTPTLTSIPSTGFTDGAYYDVIVSGLTAFSGSNFTTGTTLNIGDKLKKKGNQWYLIKNVVGIESIDYENIKNGILVDKTDKLFSINRTYLYVDGSYIIDSAYLNTDFIKLKNGDKITFSSQVTSTSYCVLAVFDENKIYNKSKSIQSTGSALINYTFTATDDCFVIVQNRPSTYSSNYVKLLNFKINDINNSLNTIMITDEQIIDVSSEFIGGILYTNGSVTFDGTQNYKHTGFIHLFDGDYIDYELNGASGYAVLAYFDINRVYQQAKSIAGKNATIDKKIYGRFISEEECYVVVTNNVSVSNTPISIVRNITNQSIIKSLESYGDNYSSIETSDIKDISVSGNYIENSGVLLASGMIQADAVYFLTDYIYLSKGSKIEAVGWASSSYAQVSVFTNEKVYDSTKSIAGSGSAKLIEYIATENCFVRIQSRVAQLSYPSTYRVFFNSNINDTISNSNIIIEKDVNLMLMIGQSNAVGTLAQNSTNNNYDSLQLSNGIKASTTNLSSSTLVSISTTEIETPLLSQNEMFLNELCKAKLVSNPSDYQYQTIVCKIAEGGIDISTLLLRFYQLYQVLDKIVSLVKAQNKNICIPIVSFLQGEADKQATTDLEKEIYKEKVKKLFRAIEWYVNFKLNQNTKLQFVIYQVSSFESFNNINKRPMIPIAHFELATEMANVTLGSTTYQLPYSDKVHTNLIGTRIMGGGLGYWSEKKIIEGENKKPIVINNYYIEQLGSYYAIYIKFDLIYPPLKIDTTDYTGINSIIYADYSGNTTVPNIGFELKNQTWGYGTPDIWTAHNNEVFPNLTSWDSGINIISAQVVRKDTIKIMCDANPVGKELWYARRGNQCGGYLRDSMFETKNTQIKVNTTMYNIHNWIPTFMLKLN